MAPRRSSPVQAGNESGTVDEPSNEPQGLHEPETEDIKTVPAGNTIYSSATSFEDLQLSPELLQVQQPCQANGPFMLDLPQCARLKLLTGPYTGLCRGCTQK